MPRLNMPEVPMGGKKIKPMSPTLPISKKSGGPPMGGKKKPGAIPPFPGGGPGRIGR